MFSQLIETIQSSLGADASLVLLLIASGIYFMAGVIKGTLGIGFPTAAVSLLAQVTDARTAITIVIMPMLVTNIWQVIRAGRFLSVIVQMWLLLSTMLLFILVFAQLAATFPVSLLTALLGLIVAIYALHSLFSKPFELNPRHDKKAQLAAGICAGVMGGLVSVWAPPVLMYMQSKRIEKEEFVAIVGVLLVLGSLVLLISYTGNGTLSTGLFLASSLLIVPSMAGFSVGEYIRLRISARRFERLLLWFFFLMGLNLIRRAYS